MSQVTYSHLDSGKLYRKLKDLGMDGHEAQRWADRMRTATRLECGKVRGKQVLIRKTGNEYAIEVTG